MKDALIADEVRVAIDSDTDIVAVRQSGRDLAAHYGLPSTDLVGVATAISELARNILRYAARGVIILRLVDDYDKRGVEVLAADAGPGIRDVALATDDGARRLYLGVGSAALSEAALRAGALEDAPPLPQGATPLDWYFDDASGTLYALALEEKR